MPKTFTTKQLDALRADYELIEGIDPCGSGYGAICKMLDRMNDDMLKQVAEGRIKFLSLLAINRCSQRGIKL